MRSSPFSPPSISPGQSQPLPTLAMVQLFLRFYLLCKRRIFRLLFRHYLSNHVCRDAEYFRQSSRPSAQPSDNWVLRFGSLKRLYRLMTQYFSDYLHKPTTGLDVPNLQTMAKDHNIPATLIMCRLTIAIGVQCEKNKEFIDKIQSLSETDQHYLMKAIEQVCFSSRSQHVACLILRRLCNEYLPALVHRTLENP